MATLYETLFAGYAEPILRDLERNYDEASVKTVLERLSLSQDTRRHLEDLFLDSYYQWSADAFALGLHLGLSLFHDNVRRNRAQQV